MPTTIGRLGRAHNDVGLRMQLVEDLCRDVETVASRGNTTHATHGRRRRRMTMGTTIRIEHLASPIGAGEARKQEPSARRHTRIRRSAAISAGRPQPRSHRSCVGEPSRRLTVTRVTSSVADAISSDEQLQAANGGASTRKAIPASSPGGRIDVWRCSALQTTATVAAPQANDTVFGHEKDSQRDRVANSRSTCR